MSKDPAAAVAAKLRDERSEADRQTAAVIEGLSETERAALPTRLRALVADDIVIAWNAAKAERDAAIAAATVVDEKTGETTYDAEAVAAAKAAWQAAKAELQAEG